MSTLTQQSATNGQIKQIARVASDAAEKAVKDYANFSKDGAQRVHGNPEFAVRIREATILALTKLSVTDKFKDEEVRSSYTYPNEYDGPKPIEEQVTALAEILGLDPVQALEYAKNLPELPAGAEGWFAIPSSDGLKKLFPKIENDAERYCAGVRLVHEKLSVSRKLDGQITPGRLRVHARTAHALDLVAEHQPGDILIVAGQLGMRHRGRSVRRARECFDSGEFGLGALAVGSIVLTHPKRLVRWEELDMDCSGDEFDDPGADDRFDHVPGFFRFHDGGVRFGTNSYAHAYAFYGSASAFVPQF
jgi:hypothetical protein